MFRSFVLLGVISLWALGPRIANSATCNATKSVCKTERDVDAGCSREFLYLEFTTASPPSEVKERFEGLTIIFIFKVLGVGRYIAVIENDQSDALKNLALPKDACTTVTVFPLFSLKTFLASFDIPWEETESLPPKKIRTFIELTWDAAGLNEDQYAAFLAQVIRQVSPFGPFARSSFNVAVATLKTKFIFFWKENDCETADALSINNDPFGGPGLVSYRILKIHAI